MSLTLRQETKMSSASDTKELWSGTHKEPRVTTIEELVK